MAHGRGISRTFVWSRSRSRARLGKVDEYTDDIGDPSACVGSWMNRSDELAQNEQALARLAEGPRSTLALRLEGKSYAEIAEILGISERNASVRLVRARQRIADQLRAA